MKHLINFGHLLVILAVGFVIWALEMDREQV